MAMRVRLTRTRLWLVTVALGGTFVLSGCDPSVREQILTGVGSAASGLATTFIQAFFQGLINKAQDDNSATTVTQVIGEKLLPTVA
jgi:hypothetical protein